MECKHHGVGYAGQRYEVRADLGRGIQEIVGWTDAEDGGALVQMVNLHPEWKNPVVVQLPIRDTTLERME